MEVGNQRNLVNTRFGGALFQLMRHQMRMLMSFHLLDDADPQAEVIELPRESITSWRVRPTVLLMDSRSR